MQSSLSSRYSTRIEGKLLLKKDSHLPISGFIKARGGIYEVLVRAEKLALKAGLLDERDDYSKLCSAEFRQFFGQYRIAVGSTEKVEQHPNFSCRYRHGSLRTS
ncbi:D-serine dehydratase [Brenneria goodwinii]|uniref:D-serine dehydratase n=1 Tax=Brenneria goodwinii TaxID=1109412 RepID=A0A0G4JYG9_9GAMM|nr:D-serine dehydratase [Brenneria goodwinii]